jgi:hypothetical protein
MKMTHEQLGDERKRLVAARGRLERRRADAEAGIAGIEASYPGLLVQVAEGKQEETVLTGTMAELVKLRGIMAEPTATAVRIMDDKIRRVDAALQKVRTIQRVRNDDLEFRKFFNKILRQQRFYADEEERLRQMAGFDRKAVLDQLCTQFAEYRFKESGPVRFEDVVTVPPFSEEPDTSVIEIEA